MTRPEMLDAAKNFRYYATNDGYHRDDARFREERNLWVVNVAAYTAMRLGNPALFVLDAGANDGFLAQMLPGLMSYKGLELNPMAIENAYPRAMGFIERGNVCTWDYPKEAYDLVVCMEVLEHVPDARDVVQKLVSALAPGGTLVTTSPIGLGRQHEPANGDHLVEWSPPEYLALHADVGCDVIEHRPFAVYNLPDGRTRYTQGIHAIKRQSEVIA